MNLFHADLEKLTYEEIEAFCTQNLPEGTRLDYKRDLSSKDPAAQVAQGVSAFANTLGGILVYGVGTRTNTKFPDWPSDGMAAVPDFERRVVRWCIEHIDPPIAPVVGYVENPHVAGRAFAVIRTDLSRLTPHVTWQGERIYVRRGDNSDPVPATFTEIESLRNQRERAMALEEQEVEDLRRRMGLRTRPTYRSFFLIVRPEFSSEDAIPRPQLPALVRKLGRSQFKVGELVSYSRGVTCTGLAGWSVFATSRGHFGYSWNQALAGGNREEPIGLEGLLSWSLLAGKAAALLCEAAGYWGRLEVSLEVYGHQGVEVKDAGPNWRLVCADDDIRVQQRWAATELQRQPFPQMASLCWMLMWSVGMGERTWSQDTIVEHLRRRAEDIGLAY